MISKEELLDESEERILSGKRSSLARTFEAEPCHESKLSDLNLEVFKIIYLPKAIDSKTLEKNHRDIKEQLASLKFFDLIADKPTNLGIIMFGKKPKYFLPGNYIQFVKFNGVNLHDEIDFSKEFVGDLVTELKNIDDFIKYIIIREKLVRVSMLREEKVYNYPYWALREMFLNAIIHRNYQSNTPIKFYQFSDRIEITNTGGLYGETRPENFPNINSYRNPEIASVARN